MMSRKQAQELSDDLLWTICRAERVSAIAYGRHVPGWQDITGSAVLTLSTVIDHLGQAAECTESEQEALLYRTIAFKISRVLQDLSDAVDEVGE